VIVLYSRTEATALGIRVAQNVLWLGIRCHTRQHGGRVLRWVYSELIATVTWNSGRCTGR